MAIIIYFGVPGSGKTTHAASIVYKNLKAGYPTFSNVDIEGSIPFSSRDDVGVFNLSDADMIIDEASIEYNNRAYKSMPQSQIQWFKLYRHYGIRNIYVYSQSYADMDVTLRRLADKLFVVRKSIIPGLITTVPIKVKIGIDEQSHQIIDQYFFDKLHFRSIRARKYWCMFDSWSAPPLMERPFIIAGHGDFNADKKYLKSIYKDIRDKRFPYRLFHRKRKTLSGKSARINLGLSRFLSLLRVARRRESGGAGREAAINDAEVFSDDDSLADGL